MIGQRKKYRTFEELYEDNKKLVFYYIKEKMNGNQDAEELSSQVWAKAGKHHRKIMEMDKPAIKRYLLLTVDSVVKDDKARLAREAKILMFQDPSDLEELLGITESVEDTLQRKSDRKSFREALQMLTEDERQILFLYRLQKKSSKEIAKLLDTTDGNVRVKVHRIIEKLETVYEQIKERGEGYVE